MPNPNDPLYGKSQWRFPALEAQIKGMSPPTGDVPAQMPAQAPAAPMTQDQQSQNSMLWDKLKNYLSGNNE